MADSIPPNALIGDRYALRGVIGEGAMGVVHEAADPEGRPVAVKVLVRTDAEGLARFRREIEVCARIEHPNVVPVLDHGVDEAIGVPYFVMPLLRGGDLSVHMKRTGAMPVEVTAPLVVQACRGVATAHQAGVIHRDIKPSNLILEETDGQVTLLVADFGLATAEGLGGKLTRSGALLGTPHYISPEQSTDPKAVDARADVWSLGMVLFQMLAGAPAFANAGVFMSFLVQKKGVPPLQDVAPWIDGRIARVVHAALIRAIDARWPDVGELLLGLEMAVGFDVARRKLSLGDIVGVGEATRGLVAPRAEIPQHWDELLRG